MANTEPLDGYLLVVTYGRSGSTLLQCTLQTIDGYCIRGENNNTLMPVFQAYKHAKKAKNQFGRRPKPKERPWHGAHLIDPDKFAAKLVDAFRETILVPDEGSRVVGFKEIRFNEVGDEDFPLFMDFIRTYMAPCRIIFNCRNAADVANSSWNKNRPEAEVLDEVSRYDALYNDYTAKHPDTCFVIQYEEYRGNPDGLKPLFEFLREPFDRGALEAVLDTPLNHAKKGDTFFKAPS